MSRPTGQLGVRALGQIVLDAVGEDECMTAYSTTSPHLVGAMALAYNDINPDGSLN